MNHKKLAGIPVHSSKQLISLKWFDKPWQLNGRILKHCKNQGTRHKKRKIFHADSLKLEKINNNSSVTFEFGLLWGNSREKFAALSANTFQRTSRPKIAPQNVWLRKVFGFLEKRTPASLSIYILQAWSDPLTICSSLLELPSTYTTISLGCTTFSEQWNRLTALRYSMFFDNAIVKSPYSWQW